MAINTLIIGAGLAGLKAAKHLQDQKISYMLVEKGPVVGGRLATVTIPNHGIADIGAQFFSAHAPAFKHAVDQWCEDNIAYEIGNDWTDGSIRRFFANGDSRYAIYDGMGCLAQYLSESLNEVYVNYEVSSIHWRDGLWRVSFHNGKFSESENLVVTAPPPQALKLFATISLHSDTLAELKRIHYQPNLTAVFVVDGATNLPESGGVQSTDKDGHLFRWLYDNSRKNEQASFAIITMQGKRIWSKQNFERDTDPILSDMREALQPYLADDAKITTSILKRWQYGAAMTTYPHLVLEDKDLPVIFAGDAFGGHGRVEGAFMSGLTAGQTLAQKYQPV